MCVDLPWHVVLRILEKAELPIDTMLAFKLPPGRLTRRPDLDEKLVKLRHPARCCEFFMGNLPITWFRSTYYRTSNFRISP